MDSYYVLAVSNILPTSELRGVFRYDNESAQTWGHVLRAMRSAFGFAPPLARYELTYKSYGFFIM